MRLFTFIGTVLMLCSTVFYSNAQVNARMFRFPDVSAKNIVFSYAGDLWVVAKEGGVAHRLSSPKGEELFAKFSPDGSEIAYSASYDDNRDVYVIPTMGGVPKRLTFDSGTDRTVGWTPDGKSVLFASSRESGRQRFNQLYTIAATGGEATKLPLPYGDFASYSPDGTKLALNYKSRVFRTWKRYRGGWAPDIYIFDLKDFSSKNITRDDGSDEFPMWHGNKVYYLSDRGEAERYNIWVYDIATDKSTQLTHFTDYDVHFPSLGPDDIVFEADGNLYLMDLKDDQYHEVNVKVVTDELEVMPKQEKVKDLMQSADIAPDGNRALVMARGDLFSVPAEHGVVSDLTQSSGSAERFGAWSPDGKTIAYWSDASGEYNLMLKNVETGEAKKVTDFTSGYRYHLYWSPDSKKIAFIDQAMNISYFDIPSNKVVSVDKGLWMYQGALQSFSCSWSPDSRWLTYDRGLDNRNDAIFIYDTQNKIKHQVTSGHYDDHNPVFGADGKYLFLFTGRSFKPQYSDLDNTFIYPKTTEIAAIPLRKDIPSAVAPRNDVVDLSKKENGDDEENDKKEDAGKEVKSVSIDFDNFEERLAILPPDANDYSGLSAKDGKIFYQTEVDAGKETEHPVKYYDLKKREEKTVVEDADGYRLSANGKKMLVRKGDNLYIIKPEPEQKLEKALPLDEMVMTVNPRAEWRQIFNDVWRFERDFFYDKHMHGVDWNAQKVKYGKLLDDAVTRWDVNYVLGELIGELSSSHTYRGGGDLANAKKTNTGYLGVNWEADGKYYRIKKIIDGAPWDSEVRSPLSAPDLRVHAGDYILSVNGRPITTDKEPYEAFQGLADKTVELMVNSKPDMQTARKIVVKTLSSESRLRNLAWIEAKREKVDKATDGKVGYIYVRSTGIDGQNDLVRQYMAQWNKEGLIIDERFNSGGQIPDRFIELLNRKNLAYFAVRDGKDWSWPPKANFGPKVMLINGWSGSGGDAFPDFFRKAGLGPLIGTRTWGGLIGITGAPELIDGGYVTIPTFRMYNPDGSWFKEGHGVDPDIVVKENLTKEAKGDDPQLDRAIEWVNNKLKDYKGKPEHAPYEKR
ncbi:S41 family peptidase [Prolixibacter denitrificans]|uniref:Tricorn protease homolog n=2 Tax=Prolixibacter denitrificans TaxID=1541063 RepID=A0A2P8CKB1_9BACT|nr:S41 family peptidase [Prolixibacter denitrificans]PSK85385.1 tricorn protease [Prolixibacter denitrificans]